MLTFKQYLQEAVSDTMVFAFGRYSPPTRGHIEHFRAVKDYAIRAGVPYMVYTSKTVEPKKNPVPVPAKIAYIKKAIPDLKIEPAVNMFVILGDLIEKGYKNVVYFAGGDYFTDSGEKQMFERLVAEAKKAGVNMSVQSSGERSEGISGTALRQAVMNDDFKTFLQASPVGIGRLTARDAQQMFEITKHGLAAPPPKKIKPAR